MRALDPLGQTRDRLLAFPQNLTAGSMRVPAECPTATDKKNFNGWSSLQGTKSALPKLKAGVWLVGPRVCAELLATETQGRFGQ